MLVAYVGNFRPSHSTENHVAGSLRALGHDVLELQEDDQHVDTLAARVIDADAALLLYTKTWGLDPTTTIEQWAQLEAAGIPTVSYHLDLYVGLEREAQLDFEPFWRTRYVFSADGGHAAEFAAHGIDHEWLRAGVYRPECVDGKPSHALRRTNVAFVGSHRNYHPEWPYRQQLVKWLRTTYRGRFTAFPTGHVAVRGQALNDLYATVPVIVGDTLCPGFEHPYYWSDRVYETLGRGGFLIHPFIEGMQDEFVDGEHLRFYRFGDFEQLREIIDHYVAHPDEARAIARHGQSFVRDHCSYEARVSDMLDKLIAKGALQRDVSRSAVAARHRSGATARIVTRPDVTTDAEVVREVWGDDQYRLTRELVAHGVVVDVGANIGAFAVLAAKLGACVHAYEPESSNAEQLAENVAGLDVSVYPSAVLGHAAAVRLAPGPGGMHGGGTHIVNGAADPAIANVADAEAIDQVMVRAIAASGDGRVRLLKLDCEGSEYDIIEGLSDQRLDAVQNIVMEFHGPGMPHLEHLDDDGEHLDRWGAMVVKLAAFGHITTMGRPSVGGLLTWRHY